MRIITAIRIRHQFPIPFTVYNIHEATKRHYHRYSERYDNIRYSIDLFVAWHMTYNAIVLLHYSDFRNGFKCNCTRVIVTLACPISTWAWVTIKINIFCQNNYLDIHCLHNIKHKTPWRFSYLVYIFKMLLYSINSKWTHYVIK